MQVECCKCGNSHKDLSAATEIEQRLTCPKCKSSESFAYWDNFSEQIDEEEDIHDRIFLGECIKCLTQTDFENFLAMVQKFYKYLNVKYQVYNNILECQQQNGCNRKLSLLRSLYAKQQDTRKEFNTSLTSNGI